MLRKKQLVLFSRLKETAFILSKSVFNYSDGGFDITAKTSIYTIDEIVLVVNDFKRHGFVHYPGKYHALHLWREDYHANISAYPIALYKNEKAGPHLILRVAWNHIQIMKVGPETKTNIICNLQRGDYRLFHEDLKVVKAPFKMAVTGSFIVGDKLCIVVIKVLFELMFRHITGADRQVV